MLTINQSTLKIALTKAGTAVPTRAVLPIMETVRLTALDTVLAVRANNLEWSVIAQALVCCDSHTFDLAVPYKLLNDLVTHLPNDTITLSILDNWTLRLECRGTSTKIKGFDPDDCPIIPDFTVSDYVVELKQALLKQVLDRVSTAAADEHTNPVLTGVLMEVRSDKVTVAAIDGYRLAVQSLPCSSSIQGDLIIPKKAIEELVDLLSADPDARIIIRIDPKRDHLQFLSDDFSLITRLIYGTFPDFRRFLPHTTEHTELTLPTDDFKRTLKRVALFATAGGNIARFDLEGGSYTTGGVRITASATECGDSAEHMDHVLIDGKAGAIALNIRYVQEAVASLGNVSQLTMRMTTPNSPCLFMPDDATDYTCLVMPMRLTEPQVAPAQ